MNKITSYIGLLIIVLSISLKGNAQQTPLTNFYQFNPYLIHPAYAGHTGGLQGTLSHRLQWLGIDGAPTTSYLGLHTNLGEKMGLGARLTLDETDIISRFSGALTYAYRVKLGNDQRLAFGVSGVIFQNSINFQQAIIDDATDDLLQNGKQSGMAFDAEAGLLYTWKGLQLGFTTNQLLQSGIKHKLASEEGMLELRRHFTASASYYIVLNEVITIQPSLVFRNQQNGQSQIDGLALLSWKKSVYVGGGYRQDIGPLAMIGLRLAERLLMAYSFEFAGSGIAQHSNGTHEFMLGISLAKRSPKKEKEVAEETEPEEPQVVEETVPEEVEEPIEEEPIIEEPVKEEKPETREPEVVAPDTVQKAVIPVKTEPVEKVKEPVKEPIQVKSEKAAAPTPKVDRSIFERKVQFEFEQAGLDQESKELLDQIAEVMKQDPTINILVRGHACNMGGDAINQVISKARAETVRNYLVSKGVDKGRIETKAMSDGEPLVPNTSIPNRQQNRRVDFRLVK